MSFARFLFIVAVAFSFFGWGNATADPYADFWTWFQQNDSRLFAFEKDQDGVFASLSSQLQKVDPDLTFEFGPVHGKHREFVISAGGIQRAFPAVEKLFATAPKLDHWIWVKFRPRRDPMDVQIGTVQMKADDVSVTIEPDGQKAGLTVFMHGYQPDPNKTYEQIAYLMLDQALGEYDVETKVGFITIKGDSESTSLQKVSLKDLPKAFDDFVQAHAIK